MSLGGGLHGAVTSRVSFLIGSVVYGDDLGMVFAAGTGFFLERAPDTVKAPDFAFVAYERLPDPLPEGYVPLVPDLAVETRSPNDTAREVAEKVEEWLAAGVRLVWVIEPRKRTITTHRLGRPPHVLGIGDTLGRRRRAAGLVCACRAHLPAAPELDKETLHRGRRTEDIRANRRIHGAGEHQRPRRL